MRYTQERCGVRKINCINMYKTLPWLGLAGVRNYTVCAKDQNVSIILFEASIRMCKFVNVIDILNLPHLWYSLEYPVQVETFHLHH